MDTPYMPGGSRVGKKQIVCYISPEDSERYYQYCLHAGWTRQELLARAINYAMQDFNEPARLDYQSKRLFRIPNRRRSVRENASGRTGKMAIAGWYPVSQVERIAIIVAQHDMSLQDVATYGLMMITQDIEENDNTE